ncbi:hypothetical protein [Clostridium perfringens]|uniref:hypothetical protein n=1 Tax=Clostridium perfringens TaxID=1502 RepID=UPI0039E8E2A8
MFGRFPFSSLLSSFSFLSPESSLSPSPSEPFSPPSGLLGLFSSLFDSESIKLFILFVKSSYALTISSSEALLFNKFSILFNASSN